MSRIVLLIALGGFLGQPFAAHAEEAQAPTLKAWDSAEVERLARRVQLACSDLRDKQRKGPPTTVASGQEHSRMRYKDLLFQAEGEARRLADGAAAGKTLEESRNAFRTVDGLQRDVAEQARRMFLPKATIDELQEMRADIEQLRLYFQGAVDESPQLVGPSKKKE